MPAAKDETAALEPKTPQDLIKASLNDLHCFLSADDARLRADAACSLGDRLRGGELTELPDDTQEKLAAQLEDEDRFARLEAAIALVEVKDRRATPVLMALCNAGKTRLDAIHALGVLGDVHAAELLRAIMGRFWYPWADKLQAAAALCRMADGQGAQYLVDRLSAWRSAERAAALHFIGESRHPRGYDILEPIARDDQHPMQDVAIRSLGHLGDRRAINLLKGLFDSAPAVLQNDIQQALERLHEK
jgi:HEAT repeat protein